MTLTCSFTPLPTASMRSNSSLNGASWLIIFPRILPGLILHYALMDVAISAPHVYSQLFFIININSWFIFIPFKMLQCNTQLCHVFLPLLNTTWTLLPIWQPPRCLWLHFVRCSWWRWTRSKYINVRYCFIFHPILQWTMMRW